MFNCKEKWNNKNFSKELELANIRLNEITQTLKKAHILYFKE